MAEKKWFEVTQKISVNDNDKILVYDANSQVSRTVEVGLLKGADNLTNEYVELEGKDGKLYRVFIDKEGNTKAIKSEAFTGNIPNESDNLEIDDLDENGEQLEIDKNGLFLFSLSFINTEDEPVTKLNYEEKNGEIVFKNAQIDGVEIDTEIFIEREDGEFFLTSTQKFNGIEVYRKRVLVKYSDLMACLNSEDLGIYDEID